MNYFVKKRETAEWYSSTSNGFLLIVKISPSSKTTRLLACDTQAPWLKISISAAPEKGKANHMLLSFLAKLLHVPLDACAIVSGDCSSKKRVLIGKKIPYDELLVLLNR